MAQQGKNMAAAKIWDWDPTEAPGAAVLPLCCHLGWVTPEPQNLRPQTQRYVCFSSLFQILLCHCPVHGTDLYSSTQQLLHEARSN